MQRPLVRGRRQILDIDSQTLVILFRMWYNEEMDLFRKISVVFALGTSCFLSIAFGLFDAESIRIQNIETGFLSYTRLEGIQRYEILAEPTKTVDMVDWEALKKIPNRSIEQCSNPSTSSESWQFLAYR